MHKDIKPSYIVPAISGFKVYSNTKFCGDMFKNCIIVKTVLLIEKK